MLTAAVVTLSGVAAVYEWNSFSSPFGADTYVTYLRAPLGRPTDMVPKAGSDGC